MATKFLGTLKVVPKLVASDRKIGRSWMRDIYMQSGGPIMTKGHQHSLSFYLICFNLFQYVSIRFNLFQSVSICVNLFQSVSICFKLIRLDSICLNTFQSCLMMSSTDNMVKQILIGSYL